MNTPKIKLKNGFKPYPDYLDSGIDLSARDLHGQGVQAGWIGKIPSGWEIKSVKRVAEILPSNVDKLAVEGETPVRLCNYTDAYKNETIIADMVDDLMIASASHKQIQKLSLREDDVIITKDSETPDDIGIPAYVPKSLSGVVCGYHLAVIRPQKIHGKYLFRFFQTHEAKTQFFLAANGLTRYALGIGDIGSTTVPVPPLETQKKIAEYLDEKTALIDRIIERKKKLIALLREKRTAVINHAVTTIREGELVKMKHCVLVNPSKKVVSMTDLKSLVSFVPMEALSENGQLELQERPYKDVKDGFTYFEDNDVVLAKITPCYENGKAGVMRGLKNGFGFGTTEFMVLRADKKNLPEYLYFLIYSDKFRKSGEIEMRGTAGQKRVSNTFVKNYAFVLPSLEVQRKTVKELERKTQLFDLTFEVVEKSIETLKEFKSSLISNVVTGKVKI